MLEVMQALKSMFYLKKAQILCKKKHKTTKYLNKAVKCLVRAIQSAPDTVKEELREAMLSTSTELMNKYPDVMKDETVKRYVDHLFYTIKNA